MDTDQVYYVFDKSDGSEVEDDETLFEYGMGTMFCNWQTMVSERIV